MTNAKVTYQYTMTHSHRQSSFYLSDLSIQNASNIDTPDTLWQTLAADTFMLVTSFTYLLIIFILSLIGNSLVLYMVIKHLGWESLTNIFILSLSICDLLATLTCMPITSIAVIQGGWSIGNASCIIFGTMQSSFAIFSTLMVACIAVDRFLILGDVPRATGASKLMTITMISGSCFTAFVLSIPFQDLIQGGGHILRDDCQESNCMYYHCMYIFHILSRTKGKVVGVNLYKLAVVCICFLFPFMVMSYCSLKLLQTTRKGEVRVRPATTSVTQVWFRTERRTAKTVIFMVLLCVVSKAPYLLMGFVKVATGETFTRAQDTISMWLFWTSSAINPIIYAVRNPTFAEILHIKRQNIYRADGVNSDFPTAFSNHCRENTQVAQNITAPRFHSLSIIAAADPSKTGVKLDTFHSFEEKHDKYHPY